MPIEITMPRLSDTMESGTVLKWRVSVGDEVSAGDILADIETDKATMEMQSFDDGKVSEILVKEGDEVSIGTPIAVIFSEDESGDVIDKKEEELSNKIDFEKTKQESCVKDQEAFVKKEEDVKKFEVVKSSPLARRIAGEHGLDIDLIRGTGPNGRVIKRDVLGVLDTQGETKLSAAGSSNSVERVASNKLVQPIENGFVSSSGRVEPITNMRKTIARRLVESKQTIPHYQVTITFDMDSLLDLRKEINSDFSQKEVKISVNDFLVRACALSMEKHPLFNASWGGDHLVYHSDVNIGVAVALPEERGGGLVVATIRHANHKSLRQISAETKYLAEKAKTVGLSQDELDGATFTISNLGMFGVDNFTAIINPPNSAILAVGSAIKKPVVRNEQIVVGSEMSATLSLDHRVIDGAMAAGYLRTLKHQVEQPMSLVV